MLYNEISWQFCELLQHCLRNEPHHEKTCLWHFRRGMTQTSLICSATEIHKSAHKETRDIILPRQWTTKVLIRLHGCEGWAASLLCAYGINRFSHYMAQIKIYFKAFTPPRTQDFCGDWSWNNLLWIPTQHSQYWLLLFFTGMIMVGKQSLWYLSFVYPSHMCLTFRTRLKFGKYLG